MTVDELIQEHFQGSTKALCDALGVTKGAVSHWRRKGIPKLRQYEVRELLEKQSREAEQAAA